MLDPLRQAAAAKFSGTRGSGCGVARGCRRRGAAGRAGQNGGLWRRGSGVFRPFGALSATPLNAGIDQPRVVNKET